jgi:hypothetical protein
MNSATAWQQVAQRLDRLVAGLERVKRDPNRREAYYALLALEYLQTGDADKGLEAVEGAERVAALPPEIVLQRGPYDTMTRANLRSLFEKVVPADCRQT